MNNSATEWDRDLIIQWGSKLIKMKDKAKTFLGIFRQKNNKRVFPLNVAIEKKITFLVQMYKNVYGLSMGTKTSGVVNVANRSSMIAWHVESQSTPDLELDYAQDTYESLLRLMKESSSAHPSSPVEKQSGSPTDDLNDDDVDNKKRKPNKSKPRTTKRQAVQSQPIPVELEPQAEPPSKERGLGSPLNDTSSDSTPILPYQFLQAVNRSPDSPTRNAQQPIEMFFSRKQKIPDSPSTEEGPHFNKKRVIGRIASIASSEETFGHFTLSIRSDSAHS